MEYVIIGALDQTRFAVQRVKDQERMEGESATDYERFFQGVLPQKEQRNGAVIRRESGNMGEIPAFCTLIGKIQLGGIISDAKEKKEIVGAQMECGIGRKALQRGPHCNVWNL